MILKSCYTPLIIAVGMLSVSSANADDASWTKSLKDRSKRGTLHDRLEHVRGDSGKWNDIAELRHAPPVERGGETSSLDDWFERVRELKPPTTARDDNWLLFRTRQLNDNDRVWLERIERRGNQFTVVLAEAVWQGRYRKNFTYYNVVGVNLGKLEPGKYEVKWIVTPLVFKRFEGTGQPRDNWPDDEQPGKASPAADLSVTIHVAADSR